jgi:hypothetical protein
MNCLGFDAVAGDLVRDRLQDKGERDLAFEHAEVCSRCGQRLVDERALAADLRTLALATEAAEAPARVEQALLAAWREGEMEPVAAGAARFPSGRPTWLWGTAAAVLLSAGVVVLRSPGPAKPSEPPPSVPRPNTAAEALPAPEPAGALTAAAALARSAAAPSAGPAAPSADIDEGVTAGFTSLDGTYGLEDFESAHVVRVQLTPSALTALGWPVTDDGESRLVSADVVVAEDGVARAIRLVE